MHLWRKEFYWLDFKISQKINLEFTLVEHSTRPQNLIPASDAPTLKTHISTAQINQFALSGYTI